MGHEALKLELIEWLSGLNDNETIEYLKLVKDSKVSETDWWNELADDQKSKIQQGLSDIKEGRIKSHDDVKKKYGL